ncbi:sterol-4-alpha-carboxylate 3-dehydrogenase (decarboxylating) [Pneumocystis jirovecii RU7]|uniref:3-beta hydroxysteroid dehydrogenase/isomerase domain-containing protein n=1 Tax=Pneumocystis jirovecii (strain RU7) TaxID=1408657 RepID=A0A0W4ZDX5_PNEJ7|nr:sterol-4-alpha-carboxylate 3-dehydrogenase (decarboxylating) [Pneumocystis jirovecii RU7]KTW26571.1 hypothetical protein T551_03488 [Pneumocystis jirovecii RU7]
MEYPLIIGGCGFLGLSLTSQLVKQKTCKKIAVFDLNVKNKAFTSVNYFQGDICDPKYLREVIHLHRPDVIFHMASPIHGLEKKTYERVNIEGTKNLIHAAVLENVKAIIYTSSAGVVFNGNDLINVDETIAIPKGTMEAYNETKAEAERLILEANGKNGMMTVAIRPSGIFGPEDSQLIPGIITVMENRQTRFRIGNNLNLFDFTYVDNVVHAHILASQKLFSPNAVDVSGEAFFITNGEPIYFWDFPSTVWAYLGHIPSNIIYFPRCIGIIIAFFFEILSFITRKKPGLTRSRVKFTCANRYYNINKARRRLGYSPVVELEDGIKRTLEVK